MIARAAAISLSETRPSALARWPMTRNVPRKNVSPDRGEALPQAAELAPRGSDCSSNWWPRNSPMAAPIGPAGQQAEGAAYYFTRPFDHHCYSTKRSPPETASC